MIKGNATTEVENILKDDQLIVLSVNPNHEFTQC